MVLRRIKDALNPNDEKYEVLFHKYSQIRLENKNLRESHKNEMQDFKLKLHKKVAKDLIRLYEDVETTKADSFKVTASNKDLQRLMIDINKTEKTLKKLMTEFSLEEVVPSERFYDPELHTVASYEDSKGMQKGLILKTVKKGFKYRSELLKKPRVIVTK